VGGIITFIGCLFGGGFLGLMFNFSNLRLIAFLDGVFSIVLLEIIINNKKLFNAGTDNVLQLLAVGCFIYFLTTNDLYPVNNAFTYFVIMILCIGCSYRYIDSFMALIANLAAVIFIVLICFTFGNIGKMIAPFIVFIFSVSEYFILKKVLSDNEVFIYKKVIQSISTLSLLLIYCSLNYYVVCELNNIINNTHNTSIPLGFLFWMTTFFIPIIYIYRSILMKNKTLLLCGVGCLVTSFVSFRFYHSLLPTEWALFIVGLLLILSGYWLIKYLKETKNGYSSQNIYQQSNKNALLESMIASQVAVSSASAIDKTQNDIQFGGGSSGGGGANGVF